MAPRGTATHAESLLRANAAVAAPEEPPYSVANELRYFVTVGMPLCVTMILKLGVPPFFAMIIAGHTSDSSATLQASLGFARTLYNISALMPLMAMCSYFASVLPGCIGANRSDRIPRYFWRSVLLTSVFILPAVAVLLCAEPIMVAVGVPRINAQGVGVYARYMIGTMWLTLLDNHLEAIFINLSYVKIATLNALVTGIFVDVACTYFFIGRLELGMYGAALAQLTVRTVRVIIWIAMLWACGLVRDVLIPPMGSGLTDPLVTWSETYVYFGQVIPQYGSIVAGWFIFELQVRNLPTAPGSVAFSHLLSPPLTFSHLLSLAASSSSRRWSSSRMSPGRRSQCDRRGRCGSTAKGRSPPYRMDGYRCAISPQLPHL